MNKIIQLGLLAVLGVFAASATCAAATDPCALLTKTDAVKILGGAVTGGHRGNECTYRLAGTGKNVYAAVDETAAGAAYFNEAKKTGKAVSGIGAPAYFVAGSLAIMKGGKLVQVGLITGMGDIRTMNPKLPAVAKMVLSRL